jgi:hypothetical protein
VSRCVDYGYIRNQPQMMLSSRSCRGSQELGQSTGGETLGAKLPAMHESEGGICAAPSLLANLASL